MKKPFLAAIVSVSIVLCACAQTNAGGEPGGPPALEGSWQVEDIDNQGMIDSAMVAVEFGADGRVSGRGGCNRYGGEYAYAESVVSFGALAATKMACAPALMDLETKFFNRLQGELGVETAADGALVLSDDEGRILMRRMEGEE